MSNRTKRRGQGVTGHRDPRWSVEDALRVKEQLCDRLRTPDGVKEMYVQYHQLYHGSWPATVPDPWKLARITADDNAELLSTAELVWCDPPMVDLLAAAGETFPVTPVQPHHLLSPNGIVIFAQPLPALWDDPCRADQPLLAAFALTRRALPGARRSDREPTPRAHIRRCARSSSSAPSPRFRVGQRA
jgi:hypothetical protein